MMSSTFFKQFKQKWQKSQECTLARNMYADVRHQAVAVINELWFVWDQSSRQLILLNLYQLVWKYT